MERKESEVDGDNAAGSGIAGDRHSGAERLPTVPAGERGGCRGVGHEGGLEPDHRVDAAFMGGRRLVRQEKKEGDENEGRHCCLRR